MIALPLRTSLDDSSSSGCSTFLIRETGSPKTRKQSRRTTTVGVSKKTVRFDEGNNVYYKNKSYKNSNNSNTTTNCWYSEQEIKDFRKTNVRHAVGESLDDQRRGDEPDAVGFFSVLADLFCESSTLSLEREETAIVSTQLLTIELQAQLLKLYTTEYAQQWIGLESELLFAVKRKLHRRRQRLIDQVQEMQLYHQFDGDEGDFWGFVAEENEDDEDFDVQVRECCQGLTQPSVLMAHWLAIAQQISGLHHVDYDEDEMGHSFDD